MRRVFLILACVAGCGHDHLDFALSDGGRARGSSPCDGSLSCLYTIDGGSRPDGSLIEHDGGSALNSSSKDHGGAGSRSGSPSAANPNGAPSAGDLASDPRFQDDPAGYPTPAGHEPPWCDQGKSFDEVCGNDVDDDCDGTVDEFPGIGSPCRGGCGTGIYVCDTVTNALLCRGRQGCVASQTDGPKPCGDGVVTSGEQCDPAAPHEQLGVTCTADCRRPLFVRCVTAGVSNPDVCDALHKCDERIGACVPVLGPQQPRCPKIPVEGSGSNDKFYPMLETENGQCWITCTKSDQCPSVLSDCYMAFCAVPM